MMTKLFRADTAGKAGVGAGRKALGVAVIGDLPNGKHRKRQQHQHPRKGMGHEDKGRSHHEKVPVVDSAGGAASVL